MELHMSRKKPVFKQNENHLAVAYYRYSSHSQNDASIEQQQQLAKQWCENNGYQLINEYEDRAKSGTTAERPSYQLMLHEIKRIKPAVLLLWKIDRLGRDRFELAKARHDIHEAGCKIITVGEVYIDEEDDFSPIYESLIDGMAEYYSKQLSTNIKRGMDYNAAHGLTNGHKLLGYDIENKHYVINETEAATVRRIYMEFAAGKRLSDIARDLNKAGLRTKTGGTFNIHGLRKTLKNEKYLGIYTDGGQHIEDAFPAIVGKALFDKVQQRFDKNKHVVTKAEDAQDMDYWLTGYLYCGKCGHSMQGTHGRGKYKKYYYYGCGKKLKRKGCTKTNVPKERIERTVKYALAEILNNNELRASFTADITAYFRELHGNGKQIAALEEQLKDLDKGIANLVKAIQAGAIAPQITDQINMLSEQRTALAEAIEAEKARQRLFEEDHDMRHFFEEYASANIDDIDTCKAVLDYFIKRIYVYDDHVDIIGDFDSGADYYTHGIYSPTNLQIHVVREAPFDPGGRSSILTSSAPPKITVHSN